MTNREKFEAEKTEFSKVMELFNKSGMTSFDQFLNDNSYVHKFKPGDIIILKQTKETAVAGWKTPIVFEVMEIKYSPHVSVLSYKLMCLTPAKNRYRPRNDVTNIGSFESFGAHFIDDNSEILLDLDKHVR